MSAVLAEREAELRALHQAVDRARGGHGGLLVVEGPAGIGKTSLVAAVCAHAHRRGLLVLHASGGELEQDIAHGVIRQLLERHLLALAEDERAALLSGAATHALPGLGPAFARDEHRVAAAPPDPESVDHGLLWLLSDLADRAPLLLVVDDLHWVDAASLRALVYFARRVADLPVLVAATTRPSAEAGAPALVSALVALAGEVLSPALLSAAATARLCGAEAEDEVALACGEVTEGNPFLVAELSSLLRERRREGAVVDAGVVRGVAPRGVVRGLLHRTEGAGDAAQRTARALAVLGEAPRYDVLAAVAGLPAEDEAVAALGTLRRLGLLAAGSPARFVHPMIRTALHAEISPEARATAHAAAAVALAAHDAPDAEVAHHLLATPGRGDAATAGTLVRAAAAARAAGAPASAAALLERALAEPPPRAERDAVVLELGLAELAAEHMASAAAYLRTAIPALDGDRRVAAVRGLAAAVAASDGMRAASTLLDAELHRHDGEARLRLQVDRNLYAAFDPREAPAAIASMRSFAELPGDTPGQRMALANAALHLAYDPASTAAEVAAVGARALGRGPVVLASRAEASLAAMTCFVLNQAEQDTLVVDAVEHRLDAVRRAASPYGVFVFLQERAGVRWLRGELAEAVEDAAAALKLAEGLEGTAIVERVRAFCHLYGTLGLLRLGDRGAARAWVERWALRSAPWPAASVAGYADGLVALAEGRSEDAVTLMQHVGEAAREMGYEDRDVRWRAALARALAAAGRPAEARERAAEQLALSRAWGAPVGLGSALRAHAAVGDPERAAAPLAEAVEVLRGGASPVELAAALADLGRARRRDGAPAAEVRAALQEAVDLGAQRGAEAIVAPALDDLRRLGDRPRRRRFSGVESLTAAERQVAALAAGGAGNRDIAQHLFVSVRTVESHLTLAYRKLGISSRQELDEALSPLRPDGAPPSPPRPGSRGAGRARPV